MFQNGLTEKIIQIGGIILMNAFKDFNGQAPDSAHWWRKEISPFK